MNVLKELLCQEVRKDKSLDLNNETTLTKLESLIQKKIDYIYKSLKNNFERRINPPSVKLVKLKISNLKKSPQSIEKTPVPIISGNNKIGDGTFILTMAQTVVRNPVIENRESRIIIKKDQNQSKNGIENYVKYLSSDFLRRILTNSYVTKKEAENRLLQEKRRILKSISPENKNKYIECFNKYFRENFTAKYNQVAKDLYVISKRRYKLVPTNQKQEISLGCCYLAIFLIVLFSILFRIRI